MSPASGVVRVPVSIGELFDKITILRIKADRIRSEAKRANVRRELEALTRAASESEDWETRALALFARERPSASHRSVSMFSRRAVADEVVFNDGLDLPALRTAIGRIWQRWHAEALPPSGTPAAPAAP